MRPEIPITFKCFFKGGFFDGDYVFMENCHNIITKYKHLHSNEAFNMSVLQVTEKKYDRFVYRRIGETKIFEYFK